VKQKKAKGLSGAYFGNDSKKQIKQAEGEQNV